MSQSDTHSSMAFSSAATCLAAKLRPGNMHSADEWYKLLLPEIERQEAKGKRVAFRADAAFAKPEIYTRLEGGVTMQKLIGLGALWACLLVAVPGQTTAAGLTATDYEEIRNLYARYSHAYDAGDGQAVADLHTADGQFVTGGRVVADGRAALVQMPRKPEPGKPSLRHLPSNIAIEPSADGASGLAYVFLANVDNGKVDVARGGIYEDVLVKTQDGWRFKRRTFTPFGA